MNVANEPDRKDIYFMYNNIGQPTSQTGKYKQYMISLICAISKPKQTSKEKEEIDS